jgi:hypothetical protein
MFFRLLPASGDAIDAAHKQAFGARLNAASPVPAAGVRLRTRWPLAKACAVGAVVALGFAGIAILQSVLPLNA